MPQDDVPSERIMMYIIKDYRRMLSKFDELMDYAKLLEKKLDKEQLVRSEKAYKNKILSEKVHYERRRVKRLYAYIEWLGEEYGIKVNPDGALCDTSNDENDDLLTDDE